MSLTFNTESKVFIDVPAPYFGQDVVIRVNKRAIKHYVRNSQLGSLINSRTDIKDEDKIAYHVAAGLMAVCTLPDTGEFAFADSQMDDLVNKLPRDLYEQLASAAYQLDPIVVEPETLSEKKSES